MTLSRGYLKKVKEIPPNILVKKIYKKTYSKAYHIYREARVTENKINVESYPFENWSSNMTSLFNIENKKYYNDFLEKKGVVKETIESADKVCDHIFNLLGSGDVQLGRNINWNQDFKTGFIWKNKYYNKIKTIDLNNAADVKVPWELSRFQHIPTLGQAYWLTNNEKYAEEFKNQIESWLEVNPFEMSINWTCAMDVAIRACNWILGSYYFKQSKSIESDFWINFNKSLYMHGEFISKNLEKSEISNNHYITDLVGLVWLGLYFNNVNLKKNKSKYWLNLGMAELEIEIKKQVYEDGFNYEASTAYHCLVTELLLYTSILCDRNNIEFSQSFKLRLEKMSEVLMNITKSNGLIPQVGDMDSGKFIIFSDYRSEEKKDFRYLLGVSSEYFHRNDFSYFNSNQLAALWLFDKLTESTSKERKLKSVTYPQGGIHIIRNKELYLLIRCGDIGTAGKGGHSHNDQLSFELNIDGEDFIIDPGTYAYTSNPKMRNVFRSTCYHNTLRVAELEQNYIGENLFVLENQSNAKILEFGQNRFVGEHSGFRYKNKILKHKRNIVFNDTKSLKIVDCVNDNVGLKKELNFIFSPEIRVTIENKSVILYGKKYKVNMNFTSGSKLEIINKYYSRAYGHIEETKSLIVETMENEIITNIKLKSI
ncbi:alginate lyase family protein [Planococcus sp. CAU13]|uniref:alginate lyase family protein n=1 Tax=Planococcus sp. CAU13 TaxID=1541197 RepID=UPI00052FDE77|nr:alginate lyase family protein [Planococcus sp. CAU13]